MKRSLAPTAWGERDEGPPVGLTIAGGSVAIIGAALLAALVPPADLDWRFAVIVVVIGVFAERSRQWLAMAALVPLAWLVVNGFQVDRYGVLSWHGAADVYRLVILTLGAAAGLAIGYERSRRG
jgi:hypothetical protein